MKKLNRLFSTGFCALALVGCGKYQSAQNVAASAVTNLGCKASTSEMWSSLQKIVEDGDSFPSADQLESELMKVGAARGWSGTAYKNYVTAFVQNYLTTVDGIRSHFAPQDLSAWKKSLAEMEVGIRVTSVHAELQGRIASSLKELASAESNLGATCATDPTPPAAGGGETDPVVTPPPTDSKSFTTIWQQLAATSVPEIGGLHLTLATAYQSCDALALQPMTAQTPNVSGILDHGAGSLPNGGHLRTISSVSDLLKSDYYYNGVNPAKSSCFNVRQDPLIYNYGGKPYTTTSKPLLLDMFTHTTDGGPTLGIDCSAFVFSSLATAGLKTDPSVTLKAYLVNGIPSAALKEPQTNGLRCLDKIGFAGATSMLAGDIVAINGHTFMIAAVGADPLGIQKAKSLADCTTSTLTTDGFDFVIAQSAAVKLGIGINMIQGRDYMSQSTTIRNGLLAYAVASCRARFGAAPNLNSPDLSIIRHKRTAECKAPALQLAHSDCVDSCQAH